MKTIKQGLTVIGIVVMMMLVMSVTAYADYQYLDNVKVTDGFYRGQNGAIQEKLGNKYRVKLLPMGTVVTVSEAEMQINTSASSW